MFVSGECKDKSCGMGYGALYRPVPRIKMPREKSKAPRFRTRHTLSTASRPSEGPRNWDFSDLGNMLVC